MLGSALKVAHACACVCVRVRVYVCMRVHVLCCVRVRVWSFVTVVEEEEFGWTVSVTSILLLGVQSVFN